MIYSKLNPNKLAEHLIQSEIAALTIKLFEVGEMIFTRSLRVENNLRKQILIADSEDDEENVLYYQTLLEDAENYDSNPEMDEFTNQIKVLEDQLRELQKQV